MAKSRTVKETGVASGDQANIERLTPHHPVRYDVQRGGKRHSGEAVLAPTWSAELGGPPAPDEAFRIVLLETPGLVQGALRCSTGVWWSTSQPRRHSALMSRLRSIGLAPGRERLHVL